MAKFLRSTRKLLLQNQLIQVITLRTSITVSYDHNAISPEALAAAKPFEQIPGYKSLPFVGTAWVFFPVIGKFSLKKSHHYDFVKYEKFGPINRDKFGPLTLVNLYDPDDIETVFRNETKYPTRTEFTTFKAYRELRKDQFSNPGVMVLEGKEWKDLRFKLQRNMMKTKVIERYIKPMEEVAQNLVANIQRMRNEKNEVPKIDEELYKWALESIAYIGLDTRLGCLNERPNEEAEKLIEYAQAILDYMNRLEAFAGNFPWWKWFPSPTWKRFIQIMDFFSEISFKHVNKTLNEVKEKGPSLKEDDLTMAQLMMMTEGLDVSGVVTMMVDMIFAGVDSTSHTTAYLLYDLAKNPEKQDKMYREVISLLPHPSDRITPEILKKASYLKYCLKESQRLHPLIRGVARLIKKDMVLSGYKVPAGTTAFTMLQVIGKQEKHFKNPNEYIPERWMDEQNKPHSFAVLPFGFGVRSCIGRRIAELEIQCALIEIIRNFKVECHNEDMDIVTRLINVPDRDFKFSFVSRAGHN